MLRSPFLVVVVVVEVVLAEVVVEEVKTVVVADVVEVEVYSPCCIDLVHWVAETGNIHRQHHHSKVAVAFPEKKFIANPTAFWLLRNRCN